MSKNKQLDAMLHKQQMRFRQTRHNWREFENAMRDMGLDTKAIQIAELAALQCGLVAKNAAPRRFMGIDRKDTGLNGDVTIPMPGGNGRFVLPKSPFQLMQRMAQRAERGYLMKMGLRRIGQIWMRDK